MRNVLNKLKNSFIKNKKPIFKTLIFIGYIVALIVLLILTINFNVIAQTNEKIYTVDDVDKIEGDYDCILILGAGIKKDGSPTPMLRDRLIAGFEAYNHLKNVPIFLSGDSENTDYQETRTMNNVLIEKGVNENDIICDGYGLSTYESIWRAKNVYGFNKILIVSQKYHLYRAIYIADKIGLEAHGLDAALTTYGKQPYYSLRECFARIKDVFYSEKALEPKYTEIWREVNE